MNLREDFAKAIEQGDSNQIESLLASGSIDINARLPRPFNPPPLVFAVKCEARCVAVVEMLLSAGAHIDGVDENVNTACHVETRNVDLLALLLAHRPNLDIKNSDNKSPLQISLNGTHSQSRYRISVMLINAGASLDGVPDSAVAIPLASLSTVVIRALVNRGVDLNQLRGPLNWTLDAVACNCFESLTSADCRSESHCENACQ
jgi:ankyrin repeat protein